MFMCANTENAPDPREIIKMLKRIAVKKKCKSDNHGIKQIQIYYEDVTTMNITYEK